MRRTRSLVRALCGAMSLCLVVAASAAVGEPLPQWPSEQQTMLRQVEERVVETQRKLFAARQRGDQDAIAAASQQFQELQEKRRALIELTKHQLPSE